MLSLSPAKLLVLLVIALVVLGPEKLPQVARQLGAAWGDLRRLRSRLENEVRGAFPDLPPTHEVAQAVRSPLAFLDRLADEHERSRAGEEVAEDGHVREDQQSTGPPGSPPAANGSGTPGGGAGATAGGGATDIGAVFPSGPDDPSMN
jgi:sec-independent protein translocase protein TatB